MFLTLYVLIDHSSSAWNSPPRQPCWRHPWTTSCWLLSRAASRMSRRWRTTYQLQQFGHNKWEFHSVKKCKEAPRFLSSPCLCLVVDSPCSLWALPIALGGANRRSRNRWCEIRKWFQYKTAFSLGNIYIMFIHTSVLHIYILLRVSEIWEMSQFEIVDAIRTAIQLKNLSPLFRCCNARSTVV